MQHLFKLKLLAVLISIMYTASKILAVHTVRGYRLAIKKII